MHTTEYRRLASLNRGATRRGAGAGVLWTARPPALQPRGSCACGGTCPRCAKGERGDRLERGAGRLATQVMRGSGPAKTTAPTAMDGPAASMAGGQSLDAGTRAFMEAGFGRDLGFVRVHADGAAARSAAAVHALA